MYSYIKQNPAFDENCKIYTVYDCMIYVGRYILHVPVDCSLSTS